MAHASAATASELVPLGPAGGERVSREVDDQRVQVGAGPGGERRAHPLAELVSVQPALGERYLQAVRHRVPVLIGYADRGRRAGHRPPLT